MQTELLFRDKKIPVSFISSDQKAIPQLINVLSKNRTNPAQSAQQGEPMADIERIEIIGNHAILHSHKQEKHIELPLY
jgi:hypothetical protein